MEGTFGVIGERIWARETARSSTTEDLLKKRYYKESGDWEFK
jgi:hypothetical protein